MEVEGSACPYALMLEGVLLPDCLLGKQLCLLPVHVEGEQVHDLVYYSRVPLFLKCPCCSMHRSAPLKDVEKFTEKGSCPLFGSFTSAIILDVAQQQTQSCEANSN
eukprot:1157349-Pelagomonas_calceolata.AAC.1